MTNDTNAPATISQANEWFYQLLGLATGPVDTDRVQWLIDNGHLVAASQVAQSADGPWTRLDSSTLAPLLPATAGSADSDPPAADQKKAAPEREPSRAAAPAATVPEDNESEVIDGIEIDDDPAAAATEDESAVDSDPDIAMDLDFAADDDEVEPAAKAMADLEVPVITPAAPQLLDTDRPPEPAESSQARKTTSESTAAELTPRERYVRWAGVAVLIVLAGMILSHFLGGTDGAAAYETFMLTYDAFEKNRESLPDEQWFDFVRTANTTVTEALQPLRDVASAEEPELQALMWGGEELLLILRGSRDLPDVNRDRFEAFMAEYRGEPAAAPQVPKADPNSGEDVGRPTDPLFQ